MPYIRFMSLADVFEACQLKVDRYMPVHGGDISHSWQVYTNERTYFLKVNDAGRYPHMFEREANGLHALSTNSHLRIPTAVKNGIVGQQQYLLLEWLDQAPANEEIFEDLGRKLAEMHKLQQPYFGWQDDNYIGSLQQTNTPQDTWQSFYAQYRIMPLVKKLADTGLFASQDIIAAEKLCNRLDSLFPQEAPALLHGDLWSGNYMATKDGPAIFDPAVYYGHREMDIGMTLLFGGFDAAFYEAYNDVYPLTTGWQHRVPLTQLYPLLVHAVLFGGHYTSNARSAIKQYL